jgi:hypothetical protein
MECFFMPRGFCRAWITYSKNGFLKERELSPSHGFALDQVNGHAAATTAAGGTTQFCSQACAYIGFYFHDILLIVSVPIAR